MRHFFLFALTAASIGTGLACFTGCGSDGGGDVTGDAGSLSFDASFDGSSSSSSGGDSGAAQFTVSASVIGLQGTGLVLREKSGAEVTVAPQGGATQKVTFTAKLPAGTSYEVTVKSQPTAPPQVCVVTGGTGTIVAGNIESITVNCTTQYTVGGTVSGLAGQNLVLENNGAADSVTVNANGQYAFPKALASGQPYAVTVKTNPTNKWQTCAVVPGDGGAAASGTIATANVTNVNIACKTNTYDVAVNVTGVTGTGLVFRNNGGDDLAAPTSATYTFATKIESGADYDVTVGTQPTSPWQTCTVTSPKAKVAGANVTLNAACTTDKYKVGGTLSGLAGNGLVLTNNAGDDLTLNAVNNGAFSFVTTVASGGAYAVAVKTQPNGVAGETCAVASGDGTVAGADVTTVSVTCSTRTKVMVCGSSGRPVTNFIPAGSNLTVESGCAPDATVQAFIVPRSGQTQFNGPALKAWTEAGGIVLTEYYSTDNVFNAVFETNQAEVQPRFGACSDLMPSTVQFTPADPVWAAIPFVSIPENTTGCGQNIGGYPGIVPLAGWNANAVAIAYRNAGEGRVYLTDFDWQDGQGGDFTFTNTVMGYFITHRR